MSDVVDHARQLFGIPPRQRGEGTNPHSYPRPNPHINWEQYIKLHNESIKDTDSFWARVCPFILLLLCGECSYD